MHPEIVSGMGIATKLSFGIESSLFSNDMMLLKGKQQQIKAVN